MQMLSMQNFTEKNEDSFIKPEDKQQFAYAEICLSGSYNDLMTLSS